MVYAICIYQYFTRELKTENDPSHNLLAGAIRSSFQLYFVNDGGYLNDVVIPNEPPDTSIRPNQLYALAFPLAR